MKSIIFKLISNNLHQNTQHHSIISVMLLVLAPIKDCQCLRDCEYYCEDAIGISTEILEEMEDDQKR